MSSGWEHSNQLPNLTFVLGLSILVMSQPLAYAGTVDVVTDRLADEFIWDILAGEIIMQVGRRDPQYISFSDLLNVRIRTTKDSLLMTWHVFGEVPIVPEDEFINFAYFLWMSQNEEGLLNFPYPGDYPFVAAIINYNYQIRPIYWLSEVIVLTSPTEGQRYSLNYTIKNRSLDASIPLSTPIYRILLDGRNNLSEQNPHRQRSCTT